MRLLPCLSALLVLAPFAAYAQTSDAQASPVVLELFTSQGCSSCPPADALLADLATREGIIALALHVDYWDYLGWKDAFASRDYTRRQKAYAKAARKPTIFTPQMIIQGEAMAGHHPEEIEAGIAAHRDVPPEVGLELSREDGTLAIALSPKGASVGPADVQVVRFRPREEVAIGGGENEGQTITYVNIVTDWDTIARWDGASPVTLTYDLAAEGPLAVIVQRVPMGPVVAAAQMP